jgi:ceramide glucosyltransferase
MTILFAVAAAGTLTSALYFVLICFAVRRFRGAKAPSVRASPPISVLKPLHGLETGLRENLVTFFEQDYPDFELLFCARALTDPAFDIVRELMAEYQAVEVKLIASGEPSWPNARSFSVNRMISLAAHDLLVVTDSDVRVPRDFLCKVHGPVSSGRAALVTCLYRGQPRGGLWSSLEALGMSVELMSGVLVADLLEGMRFALGPATVTRKTVLERVGGMESVGDYFADDFELGSLIARSGDTVEISTEVIDHAVPPCSFLSSFRHQLLWMRSSRFSRPLGHIGTGLTYAMPWGLLGVAWSLQTGRVGFGLFWLLLTAVNRVLQSIVAGWYAVRDGFALRHCWINPLRDILGFAVWVLSFVGRTVHFRGAKYRFADDGRLTLVSPGVIGRACKIK